MDIILMLIPAALMISGVSLVIFYWSVKSDQYEDMDGEAHRILMDDEVEVTNVHQENTETDNKSA